MFFESSTEIFSFFEIWLINNPSLIDRFLLKQLVCLEENSARDSVLFLMKSGLETRPPKFGMINTIVFE